MTSLFRVLLDELSSFDSINEEIINIAKEHLQEHETIMVYCQSALMKDFISFAVSNKNVTVLAVVSSFGQNFSAPISNSAIIHISESSVFSLIHKVSKIFMDCHAVMADGAVINASGTFTLATIAKEYSIPVIILSPMYRFTPFYAFTQDDYNSFVTPHGYFVKAFSLDNLEVLVAQYDVISSDSVEFIITERGEFSNNYIYQAFAEYYNELDYGYDF